MVSRPRDEAEVVSQIAEAVGRGMTVRPVAANHSSPAIVPTDGLQLDMGELRGIRSIDVERRRVVVAPGTTVGDLGDPLWAAGLALANQGDIDSQQMAGAVSTATHGSGIDLTSLSAWVRSMRLVTAGGDVITAGESDPDLLHAAQVSIGMLGVITELEIDVVPAYRLAEKIESWSWDEAWERFDETTRSHRHYSFFWCPAKESAALYGLESPDGQSLENRCWVKLYDEVDDSVPDSAEPGRRVDRGYRIYPQAFDTAFDELEYFVPYERGAQAAAAMRTLMLENLPHSVFPLEIRTVRRDQSFLSHSYQRDSLVLSVSGMPGTDYLPYFREVDRVLGEFCPRVHWGKLHLLTREQLLERYPRAGDFIETRRRLDPAGTFLNPYLHDLFA